MTIYNITVFIIFERFNSLIYVKASFQVFGKSDKEAFFVHIKSVCVSNAEKIEPDGTGIKFKWYFGAWKCSFKVSKYASLENF